MKSRREEWRERVRAWKASGLPAGKFAQRAGVNAGTLTWWRWKLGSGRAERGGRTRAKGAVAFVEIRAAESPEPEGTAGEAQLELAVGAVRIRVPERFKADTLARVLEVLEARQR